MKYSRLSKIAVAAALVAAGQSEAQTGDPLAARFGARQNFRGASISPDGLRVVLTVARPAGGENVAVIEVATGKITPVLSSSTPLQHIGGCLFVLADRIVCSSSLSQGKGATVETMTRLYVLDIDGKAPQQLTARTSLNASYGAHYGGGVIDYAAAGKPDAVLVGRQFEGQMTTGTFVGSRAEAYGVEEVDLRTLQRRTVVQPLRSAFRFFGDGQGHVRLAGLQPERSDTGYAGNSVTYMSRPVEGGQWRQFSTVVSSASGLSDGFDPVAIDPVENAVFGFEAGEGGFTRLAKMALDGSGKRSVVLARNDADVDDLVRIGRNQRVIGASYATERRLVEYFDPAYRSLATALGKALGGKAINFLDASADERKLLITASSDTDPGTLYIYNRDTHALSEVVPVRPELAGVPMATMQPLTYKAADGTAIPAYLTLPAGSSGKGLPAIVMPHGGPASRDEWGFDWLVQYFAARGFAVLQPQFRGSTGFGSAWFQKNGFQSWRSAIGDVNDAGRWLQTAGIAAPGKLAIVGWSYGGYAALQSAVLDPDLYKAIVAVAPVTDLDAVRDEARGSYGFINVDKFVGNGPHVAEASPARHADRFKAPVLLFHGDMDVNVRQDESRLMADRLKAAGKTVTYVPFANLEHQLDDTAARTRLLGDSDAFLRRALGL